MYIKPPKIPDLPPKAILTPGATITRRCRELLGKDGVLRQKTMLFDAVPVYADNKTVVIGPLLGGASAVACTEALVNSGVEELLLLGFAGGLAEFGVKIADIVVPQGAIAEEGVSRLYGGNGRYSLNNDAQERLYQDLSRAFPNVVHRGLVWTTDAPFLETFEKARRYGSEGALAVEMELSALARLAELRGFRLSAALLISDLLAETWQPAFTKLPLEPFLKAALLRQS